MKTNHLSNSLVALGLFVGFCIAEILCSDRFMDWFSNLIHMRF